MRTQSVGATGPASTLAAAALANASGPAIAGEDAEEMDNNRSGSLPRNFTLAGSEGMRGFSAVSLDAQSRA